MSPNRLNCGLKMLPEKNGELGRVAVADRTTQKRPGPIGRRHRGVTVVAVVDRNIADSRVVLEVPAVEAELRIDDVVGQDVDLGDVAVACRPTQRYRPERRVEPDVPSEASLPRPETEIPDSRVVALFPPFPPSPNCGSKTLPSKMLI